MIACPVVGFHNVDPRKFPPQPLLAIACATASSSSPIQIDTNDVSAIRLAKSGIRQFRGIESALRFTKRCFIITGSGETYAKLI